MDAVWYHHSRVSSNSQSPPEPLDPAAPPGLPPSPGSETETQPAAVTDLIAQGQHGAAAELAQNLGYPGLAAKLFEQIWDFDRACSAARAAGELPRALRCAVSARDEKATADIVAELATNDAGKLATAELLSQLRQFGDAAQLYESAGRLEEAAHSYHRAHRDLDAARLYQQIGQDRKAGQLLERTLELSTGDERPQVQLALGRLLAGRGAYAEAATLLQAARTSSSQQGEATLELIVVLAAIGMRDGARDLLIEARRDDPELAADLDSFLRRWRDRPEGRAVEREADLIGGRYRLDRLLGTGGSGRVFLATDEVTGRHVAVKMFFAIESRGSAAFERFAREAQLAQTLRHPSLVEVYEVSTDLGFLVMELLPGGSLAQRLAQADRLTGQQVRRMALELVDGLSAAHHRGIIHRDVKPDNVFFDSRGTAKLGDFGVAHLVDLGQTQTGGLIGTLAYMSPEQITGAPITVAADLYCLGITLFEALTGRLPFLGSDFVAQHLGEVAPAPSEIDPAIAPGWNPILARLLMKNPTERTPSLVDLRGELEMLDLAGRTLPVRPRDSQQTASVPFTLDPGSQGERAPSQRYQFETALSTTAISTLVRALDTVLERTVIIERFDATPKAEQRIEQVRLLARAHTPFLQRALSLDPVARMAVFEAPSGATLADSKPALSAAELVRVWKRMARGIAAVHELRGWHGGIGLRTVVLDEGNVPTILTCGLGEPLYTGAQRDVEAVIAVAAYLVGSAATLHDVSKTVAAWVDISLPSLPAEPLLDGESLYAAVDLLDVAVLAALGAR